MNHYCKRRYSCKDLFRDLKINCSQFPGRLPWHFACVVKCGYTTDFSRRGHHSKFPSYRNIQYEVWGAYFSYFDWWKWGQTRVSVPPEVYLTLVRHCLTQQIITNTTEHLQLFTQGSTYKLTPQRQNISIAVQKHIYNPELRGALLLFFCSLLVIQYAIRKQNWSNCSTSFYVVTDVRPFYSGIGKNFPLIIIHWHWWLSITRVWLGEQTLCQEMNYARTTNWHC